MNDPGDATTLTLGQCGLDCTRCPTFLATRHDDEALRQEIAVEWTALYGDYIGKATLAPEDIHSYFHPTAGHPRSLGG